MKNIFLLASLALSAVLTLPALAQSPHSEDASSAFFFEGKAAVAKGMTREDVTLLLSTPSETIGGNVWVYWNFNATNIPAAANHDTLVLVFSDYRVSAMRLCESTSVRALIAQQKAPAPSKTVVAKK